MIKEKITKKILCDFCKEDRKALYKCTFCGKDICRRHRYYTAFTEQITTYKYKTQIKNNLCPNCFDKRLSVGKVNIKEA